MEEYKRRFNMMNMQISSIPEEIPITIWAANNAHEQTGLSYVLYLMRDKKHGIKLINTTEAYDELFKRPDHIQIILSTGEISPEKMKVIYKESDFKSKLSQTERKCLENEWLNMSEKQETLRIWQDERIVNVPEDYFDEFIIQRAIFLHKKYGQRNFIKSSRLIGDVLVHLDHFIGEVFLEYRLRKLIELGIFEFEGSLESLRLYGVRLKKENLDK
jgi:Protein of unknown function/Domain of unknown function (DUF1835)